MQINKLTNLTHLELLRETGSEGIEMVMWFVMRGALDKEVDVKYSFYHVPVSNTGYGLTIQENKG